MNLIYSDNHQICPIYIWCGNQEELWISNEEKEWQNKLLEHLFNFFIISKSYLS